MNQEKLESAIRYIKHSEAWPIVCGRLEEERDSLRARIDSTLDPLVQNRAWGAYTMILSVIDEFNACDRTEAADAKGYPSRTLQVDRGGM